MATIREHVKTDGTRIFHVQRGVFLSEEERERLLAETAKDPQLHVVHWLLQLPHAPESCGSSTGLMLI